jgi:hypothetical protein
VCRSLPCFQQLQQQFVTWVIGVNAVLGQPLAGSTGLHTAVQHLLSDFNQVYDMLSVDVSGCKVPKVTVVTPSYSPVHGCFEPAVLVYIGAVSLTLYPTP